MSRPLVVAAALALASLFSGACSSGSSTSSGTTASTGTSSTAAPTKANVCAARDQLRSSIQALTSVSLLTQGTSGIQAAVTKVRSDLDNLKGAAGTDYGPEVDALKSSLQALQTTVSSSLTSGNLVSNISKIGTQASAVGTAADNLFTLLKKSCP
jgi:hypothetical protein